MKKAARREAGGKVGAGNAREPRAGDARPSRTPPDRDGTVRIFGIHAVEAALANPARRIERLLLTENAERRLASGVTSRSAKCERVLPRRLDQMLGADTVHQGALLETEPLPEPSLDDLCAAATTGGPLVVLDQVTDPHNVGAILRSCAVFGAAGLIMTRRHSPPLGGALAKTASGALELVPVALVGNLAQALTDLADAGVRRIGLDGEAVAELDSGSLGPPVALVLGAEGKGLRHLTRTLCDDLCRIGAAGPLASLNVSNAAAVALYAASLSPARQPRGT
ncbi:MAG: 23S rRNA (guanosine(2251)-2'-O)-methyltransferase RlmB [Hyphomicrobiaceae bacterium]|nr:23S rRNA (guanosine(2251)-2'-O)-methyltransferase RlmB [Hyphomicrobiaceae bacterium]